MPGNDVITMAYHGNDSVNGNHYDVITTLSLRYCGNQRVATWQPLSRLELEIRLHCSGLLW
jgi:hypothetical protein